MSQSFYIERTLFNDERRYTEAELLSASKYIIVLAEPGAGKTELLNSLAKKLKVQTVTANKFKHVKTDQENCSIIIDAFDELAKIDVSGIDDLLAKASELNPTHLIISSRSSEWNNSSTNQFKEYIGYKPTVVRLDEFNESEQRDIYNSYTNNDNFVEFQTEITRFSLEPLLSNPQFLKLFADAYIESKGRFSDKRSIFSKAVDKLAREVNINVRRGIADISIDEKIKASSEVFAKLLLSGAEGIGLSELNESRVYPLFSSLLSPSILNNLLATRLFKLGDNPDQHRPVHKIVAEYCAADYLTKRIMAPLDSLTLNHCLPVIAPNLVVRDELRGLLGWMATLGNEGIEKSLIELDSYAVLANGDPSQLSPSSKRLLLSRLKKTEESDPYFRRGDFQRRFSTAGFFTKDVVEDLKPIIANGDDGDLRYLIIELLTNSQSAKWLESELRHILLNSEEKEGIRTAAKRCLLELNCYVPNLDIKNLIEEASNCSLSIAAGLIKSFIFESFSLSEWKYYFSKCAELYPTNEDVIENIIGERYFIKDFISVFNLSLIEKLLDILCKDLMCACGKEEYRCDCRIGKSKIIGHLLDRYFRLYELSYDALRVWTWLEHLHFRYQINVKGSASVEALFSNKELRRNILSNVFSDLTDQKIIAKIVSEKFRGDYSHSGLALTEEDAQFLVDLADQSNNLNLWASFIPLHKYHHDKEKRGIDKLRKYMREQALNKPAFMSKWALSNKLNKAQLKRSDKRYYFKQRRRNRRYQKKEEQQLAKDFQYISDNRALIENGLHFGCLRYFSSFVLENPEKMKEKCLDDELVRSALKNCHNFIKPLTPNLQQLAALKCNSQILYVESIILASCLVILRRNRNLEGVSFLILTALRTNLSTNYDAINEMEMNALKVEVDRLIFQDNSSAEQFIRQYLEPQLADPKCAYPKIELLKYDVIFNPLREMLSIEWLSRFNLVEHYALNELFEIATQYGNREKLNRIIKSRCDELLLEIPDSDNKEKYEARRKFWFVRAFYFLDLQESIPYWNLLKVDKNSIFLLSSRSGRMIGNDRTHWPILSANKIEEILNAFIDKWPKTYLPSSYGTASPSGESAYRFLTDIIWTMRNDNSNETLLVLGRLVNDSRFVDVHNDLKSIKTEQFRNRALRNFEPPTPHEIVDLLDNNAVVTVEGLRQLVVEELVCYQKDINGGEFNPANRFYSKVRDENDKRLGEVDSVEIIAERLNLRLSSQGITIKTEDQTKNQNRIDITAAKVIDGQRRLLVIEAKGQWHSELYSAASTQLYERYSIHPDAEHQGIYLVLWFGHQEKVAGKNAGLITNAIELKESIEEKLRQELKGLIDVFVLDLSRV